MLILIGKSCAGKDLIEKYLVENDMETVVTYTTRPPRPGEKDGITYHFISKEDFLRRKQEGFFAETTSYHVATGEIWYYGSAVEDLKDNKVIIVNPEGLKQLKNIESLNPVSFYITVSEETIWDRLKHRGDNIDEAVRRLNADREDFSDIINYVDFSFSNDLGLKPEILAEMILYTYKKTMEERRNK